MGQGGLNVDFTHHNLVHVNLLFARWKAHLQNVSASFYQTNRSLQLTRGTTSLDDNIDSAFTKYFFDFGFSVVANFNSVVCT